MGDVILLYLALLKEIKVLDVKVPPNLFLKKADCSCTITSPLEQDLHEYPILGALTVFCYSGIPVALLEQAGHRHHGVVLSFIVLCARAEILKGQLPQITGQSLTIPDAPAPQGQPFPFAFLLQTCMSGLRPRLCGPVQRRDSAGKTSLAREWFRGGVTPFGPRSPEKHVRRASGEGLGGGVNPLSLLTVIVPTCDPGTAAAVQNCGKTGHTKDRTAEDGKDTAD